MSGSESESDFNVSVYDQEDNLNFYGSPVTEETEQGETQSDTNIIGGPSTSSQVVSCRQVSYFLVRFCCYFTRILM